MRAVCYTLRRSLDSAGCLIIAVGVAIRWITVVTLGRQFTLRVAIIRDHKIVDHGIYKLVRHPAYLGSLVSFVGLGLAIENWISLLIAFILPLGAIVYRIKVEEKVLLDHFGTEYQEYCKRTRRLLPGVYSGTGNGAILLEMEQLSLMICDQK